MFRKRFTFAFSLMAACLLTLSLAASSVNAKESKIINTTMDILTPTSLGGTSLKPANYRVVANGSTVTLKLGNKVIAQAPAEWKESDDKATYSSIVTDGRGIKEFHFQGKTDYVEVKE